MEYENIIYQKQGSVVWVTLNRPKVLNALSPQLIIELYDAVMQVASDTEVLVMVLTGEGKAFSSGIDLKKMKESIEGGHFSQSEILETGYKMFDVMQSMPKVTIAIVNGYCFTGAMELMMVFDLIYAADDAVIGDTHAKWGILPKWGMTQRLPQIVGLLKAKEMSFTAEGVNGKEAERMGLVNKSLPGEELRETVEMVIQKILKNSPQTIAFMKELYNKGAQSTLSKGLEIEKNANALITDRNMFLKEFEKNK